MEKAFGYKKPSDRTIGKKRTVWFTDTQMETMEEIKKLSGGDMTVSLAIRIGLDLLLKELKKQDKV